MSLLSRGNAFLERKRVAATTTLIVYRRAALDVEIDATPNRLQVEQLTESGAGMRLEEWDWIVRTEDLVALGEPRQGDFIRVAVDVAGVVTTWSYIVTGNFGEPVWRFADEDRAAIRVHSKYFGKE